MDYVQNIQFMSNKLWNELEMHVMLVVPLKAIM